MGFLKPTPPQGAPAELLQQPLMDRMRLLAMHRVDNGFGSPRVFHVIYIVRLVLFYALGGALLVTLTSDVGSAWDIADWWDEPVIYQKLVLWTVLLEVLGIGGSWGPLAGHFKPMSGGFHYWFKPGTIRLPPWGSKIPGTAPRTPGRGRSPRLPPRVPDAASARPRPGSRRARSSGRRTTS